MSTPQSLAARKCMNDFDEKSRHRAQMQGGSPARVLGWEPVHRHGDQISGPALSEITSVKEESDDITVELTEMLDLQRCYFEPRDEHHGPPMLLVEETYGFNIATITLWSNARVIEVSVEMLFLLQLFLIGYFFK